MRIERHYTKTGHSPYQDIEFRLTRSEIRNPDGSTVFSQSGIEVPAAWSQVACDVLAQKYFRKAGVPAEIHIYEKGPHGFGMGNGNAVLESWPGRCEDWMKLHGVLR